MRWRWWTHGSRLVAIPILSWVLILVGAFMAVMAIWTFIEYGRKALRARGERGEPQGE